MRNAPEMRRILLRLVLFVAPANVLWPLLALVASSLLGLGSAGYGILLGAAGLGEVGCSSAAQPPAARCWAPHPSSPWLTKDIPVQYYQSVIAIQLAVAGALLFQIRYFDTSDDSPGISGTDSRIRLLLAIVLTASLFGSLEAIREGGGRWAAVLATVGLAVSVVPILLRVLPPLGRDAHTSRRDPHF